MKKQKIGAMLIALGLVVGIAGNAVSVKAKDVTVLGGATHQVEKNIELKTEASTKIEEEAKPDVKEETKPEVIKVNGKNLKLTLGEKWNPAAHEVTAGNVNDPNTKYKVLPFSWGDTENPITDALKSSSDTTTVKTGTYNVPFAVIPGTDSAIKSDGSNILAEAMYTVTITAAEAEKNAPEISGINVVVSQGAAFDNTMFKATATDKEDGDLTAKIKFEGKVDTSKITEKYEDIQEVKASVTDSHGNTTTKVFTVAVQIADQAPKFTEGKNVTLERGEKFNPSILGVKVVDKDGKEVTNVKYEGTVDTSKAGKYVVRAVAVDAKGNRSAKPFTVTVNQNEDPVMVVGKDVTISVGDKFENSMLGVKATDKEDGDLTNKVQYTGKVDTSKAGVYVVKASVADKQGKVVSKNLKVTVKAKATDGNNKPSTDNKPSTKPSTGSKPSTGDQSGNAYALGGLISLAGLVLMKKK